MSVGIGVHADKVLEDFKIVVYKYGGYNLNEPKYLNENHIYDGSITISKSCFIELETMKTPSDCKNHITKELPVSIEYSKMIDDGLIEIKSCSNCWSTTYDEKHIDIMALHILFYLFSRYQKGNKIPDYVNYNV